MLALIDNYDSFTYNLVQYFAELGQEVKVYRNDEISIAALKDSKPTAIVVSAGPCTPDEAGISMAVTRELACDFPIFGVCLGMQSMVQAYGGSIVPAQELMHGKLVRVFHEGDQLFTTMNNPFVATRYNSLAADTQQLPDCFEIIARSYVADEPIGRAELIGASGLSSDTLKNAAKPDTSQGFEIMGVRHKDFPMVGVQFHPESVLSQQGKMILQNFLNSL